MKKKIKKKNMTKICVFYYYSVMSHYAILESIQKSKNELLKVSFRKNGDEFTYLY